MSNVQKIYKEHSSVKPRQLSAKGDRREGGTAEKVNWSPALRKKVCWLQEGGERYRGSVLQSNKVKKSIDHISSSCCRAVKKNKATTYCLTHLGLPQEGSGFGHEVGLLSIQYVCEIHLGEFKFQFPVLIKMEHPVRPPLSDEKKIEVSFTKPYLLLIFECLRVVSRNRVLVSFVIVLTLVPSALWMELDIQLQHIVTLTET